MQSQEPKTSIPAASQSTITNCQKNLRRRVHSQSIHSALIMSGLLFKMGPLFQKIVFNKQGEYVLLNDLQITFRRLKRSCIIYFGDPNHITNQNEIVSIDSINKLQKYFIGLDANYDKDVTFHILYQENKKQQHELLNFLHQQNNFRIKYYSIKLNTNKNIFHDQQIQKKIFQIKKQQKSYQFPSYSEISVDGNYKKINQQRFTMYTFFAGLDFQQARQDLVKFYTYILENQIFFCSEREEKYDLLSIIEHYKNDDAPQYRNSKTIFKFYTSYVCCYKLINMCLRSLIDPRDLAYIRLLFLDIFLSVAELFTKQKQIRKIFYLTKQQLYRGCFLLQSQINQLQKLKGKYIQMNGFLSISKKKATAEIFSIQNKDNMRALIVINLPYIEKSIDIFHSFAFIQQLSQYSLEQQVLFNPLNAFKVLDVKEIDYKYYQIHLQYADIAKLVYQYKQRTKQRLNQDTFIEQTEQQKMKDEILQKITSNFDYHKSMFTLNRTQGEVFWRNQKKQCSHLFYSGLIRKILNKQKKIMQSQQKNLDYKFKFIKVSTLYKQLQKFIPKYQWFPNFDQNIELVTRLVINNKNKALQIFFYTSKIFASLYCYERSLIYALTCIQIIIHYSSMAFLVVIDISLTLFYLGKINQALAVFDWSLQMLKKVKKPFNSANLQFFLFPMYIMFIMGETEKYTKLKDLLSNILAALQKSRLNNLWKNLLMDLANIKAIIQFLRYYSQTAQSPSRSFIKIIVFIIQYLEKQLDNADLSTEKIKIMKEDLIIAANCLVNFKNLYESYKPLSKIFVIYFDQKYDEQIYDLEQIQKTVVSNEFSQLFCYELQIYLTTLKYIFKTCKKLRVKPIKQYTRLMIKLGQHLRKLNNHYLVDIYYTVMNLFCEAIIFFNQKSLKNKKQKNRNCLRAVKIFLKMLVFHI